MFRQSLGFLPGSETRGKELLWNPHFQEQVCVCVCVCVCMCVHAQLCQTLCHSYRACNLGPRNCNY